MRKKSFFKISVFTYIFALLWTVFGNGRMFIYYFISLTLHEEAHSLIAQKLGYKTDKIVISPLGATLYAETDEFSPKDEIKIALAGPICSACLAICCGGFFLKAITILWIFVWLTFLYFYSIYCQFILLMEEEC